MKILTDRNGYAVFIKKLSFAEKAMNLLFVGNSSDTSGCDTSMPVVEVQTTICNQGFFDIFKRSFLLFQFTSHAALRKTIARCCLMFLCLTYMQVYEGVV